MPRILNIVGCKNAGKTRTVELIVPRLRQLGKTVGTLKHTEHNRFGWDREGTDTYRHYAAGSEISGIFGKCSFAVNINRQEFREASVDEIVRLFYSDLDIVVTEGFRTHPSRKIEVCRVGYTTGAVVPGNDLLATYGDKLFGYDLPHFDFGREDDLAQHIVASLDQLLLVT